MAVAPLSELGELAEGVQLPERRLTPTSAQVARFIAATGAAIPIFYDPEALVEPVRIVRNYVKTTGFEEGDPYVFVECLQTIFPVDGVATPMSPGTTFDYRMLDMYGRPWGQIWEQFEEGMEKPEEEDIFTFD